MSYLLFFGDLSFVLTDEVLPLQLEFDNLKSRT